MRRMKETLEFIVNKAVTPKDSLSIILFDAGVSVALPFTQMDVAGRRKALTAIKAIQAGSTTNLSGGLLKGIDLLGQRPQSEGTRAVLLFTDGVANNGITDVPTLLEAMQGAMATLTATVFTFGFGSDHNEDCLKAIASQTQGIYYFIEAVEMIPTAFADCLGGLVSVVAQNASLLLEAAPEHTFAKFYASGYQTDVDEAMTKCTIQLGDLCSEDEKDIVLEINIPQLTAKLTEAAPAVIATLRYFSVSSRRMEEVTATLSLFRPAATPEEQAVDLKVEENLQRMRTAEALEEAARLADSGRLSDGRALLKRTAAMCLASPAAQTHTVQSLCADLAQCSTGYDDEVVYRSMGSKMSKMSAMSHFKQMSNHSTGQAYSGSKASKEAMKKAWLGGEA